MRSVALMQREMGSRTARQTDTCGAYAHPARARLPETKAGEANLVSLFLLPGGEKVLNWVIQYSQESILKILHCQDPRGLERVVSKKSKKGLPGWFSG